MLCQILKRARGLSLVYLLLLAVSTEAQTREIQVEEASSHVGETVTVRGVVANVHTSRAGNTFINFGRPYPNQVFTAVIFKERTRLFPNVHSLEGSEVLVTGEVRLYKGKPEIILRDPSQLKRAKSAH
jgi:DNA/RNA endonuclease YhcR with UshA esterase domain